MEYIIYFILLFIAFLLFVPETGSTEIRNPELLMAIAAIILIILIVKLIRLVLFAGKVKKELRENKYEIKKARFGLGKIYIVAENHRETLEICVLMRKKSYYKYHFANENRIELYKTTVGAVRSGRDIAKVTKSAEVKLAGIIRIVPSKTENAKRFIVFDQFPTTASDTVNRSLNVGDTVTESEIAVFDFKSFIESIK
jgi:hypothetical protein